MRIQPAALLLGIFVMVLPVDGGTEGRLSEDLEEKLKTGISRLIPTKRQARHGEQKKVIAEVMRATGLDAAGARRLEAAYAKAVEDSIQPWSENLVDAWRGMYRASGGQFIENIESISPSMALNPRNLCDGGTLPVDQASWREALQVLLTAEQLAKWNADAAARSKQKDEEVAQLTKSALEQFRDRQANDLSLARSDLREGAGLDAAAEKKLEAAAAALIEKLGPEWEAKLKTVYGRFSDEMRKSFLQNGAALSASRMTPRDEARSHPEWRKAVESILTPGQLAAWDKKNDEMKSEAAMAVDEYLRSQSVVENNRLAAEAESIVAEAAEAFKLTGDRLEKLREASRQAAAERVEMILAGRRAALLEMSEQERQQNMAMTNRGVIYQNGPRAKTSRIESQPSWRQALEDVLSAEERVRWQEIASVRDQWQTDAVSSMVVAELDRLVLLTSSQRLEMEKMMRSVVGSSPLMSGYDGTMLAASYARLLSQEQKDTVKQSLDAAQWRQWERLDAVESRMMGIQEMEEDEGEEIRRPAESVEQAVSDFLTDAAAIERKDRQDAMQAKVEDVKRSAGVSGESLRLLSIAAKGAVEASLREWRQNMTSYVENQTRGATPETVRSILGESGELRINFGNSGSPADEKIWQDMLRELLPAPQKSAWERELSARQAYRADCIAKLALSRLDDAVRLTQGQHEKLLAEIRAVVTDYYDAFEATYGSRGSLQTYYLSTFIVGLPEAVMTAALTPGQWKVWNEEMDKGLKSQWEYIKSRKNQDGGNKRVRLFQAR